MPQHPDLQWRHRMTEIWVRRALEYQDGGTDLLLTGQSPLGEVLAAPSAPLLDGIAVCLVDVADEPRRRRLIKRDPGRWDSAAIDAFLSWAAWHREHARDPHHRPEVIIGGSWPAMAWDRWTGWSLEDPRWRTHLIDTTAQQVEQSVDQVEQWVSEERERYRSGHLRLMRDWSGPTAREDRASR